MAGATKYTLVPKGKLLEALKYMGIEGLELEVIEGRAGGVKAIRIGPPIPQGTGCGGPFSPPCPVTEFFDKKGLASKVPPVKGPGR